ncbi:hypothetical protein [Niallia endozanthoxylica]|nr:hypothetical protein [Niallia endozanthoxylica]
MKKSKAVIKHFIKDDQFDLNQYLKFLIEQMNPRSQKQYKEYNTKKIN